jgi:uncharacterized protein
MADSGVHHILFYDYVENMLERREPHRDEHLAAIDAQRQAGRIVLSGPLGDPPHGAAIVFKGVDPEAIEAFAVADPYVRGGLVTEWRIELWQAR